jgi:hypothetical protein
MITSADWKPIPGYEGLYIINESGKILSLERKVKTKGGSFRSIPEHFLTWQATHDGYMFVKLTKDKIKKCIKVHRLVALAFIPNPSDKLQVNHKDCNKSNNTVDNLEWVTGKENMAHAVKNNLNNCGRGEKQGHSKATNEIVIKMREYAKNGITHQVIADEFNFSRSAVTSIINRKRWNHI